MPETVLSIPADELVAALNATMPHVSTSKEVPNLNGVRFTMFDRGPVIAATDRYTLAVRRLPYGEIINTDHPEDLGFTVATADAKRILRLATDLARSSFRGEGGRAQFITLTTFPNGGVRVDASHAGQVTITQLDGAYPMIENLIRRIADRVLANDNRGSDLGLNPLYLARFAKAAEKGEAIVIRHSGDGQALLITAPEFVGAIMPTRLDSITLDEWIPCGPEKS